MALPTGAFVTTIFSLKFSQELVPFCMCFYILLENKLLIVKQATEDPFFPIWRCAGNSVIFSPRPEVRGEPPSKSINQGKRAMRVKCSFSLETQIRVARALSWALGRECQCRVPTGHTQSLPADTGLLSLPLASSHLPHGLAL